MVGCDDELDHFSEEIKMSNYGSSDLLDSMSSVQYLCGDEYEVTYRETL